MLEPPGWNSRGYLPHFDDRLSLQAVTYRLADALPTEVVAKLQKQSLNKDQRRDKIERYIDAGHGSGLLSKPSNAAVVVENWLHFHCTRYNLHAWVVMPNHVHVLIEPMAGKALADIVQSWKSYTAKLILKNAAGEPPAIPGKHVSGSRITGIGLFATSDIITPRWNTFTKTRSKPGSSPMPRTGRGAAWERWPQE